MSDENTGTIPGNDKSKYLVPQPIGGAILQGGNYGNSGGGRPKSAIRELARQGANLAIISIVKDLDADALEPGTQGAKALPISEKVRAFEACAKIGVGEAAVEVADEAILSAVHEVLATEYSKPVADLLLRKIAERIKDSA